jgi:hypothetical protein
LLGALIGASASVVTMLIQSKIHDKRERMRLIKELAIHDFEKSIEIGKATGRGFNVIPLVVYMHYHSKLLEAMEKDELTPEVAKKLYDESKTLAGSLPKNN